MNHSKEHEHNFNYTDTHNVTKHIAGPADVAVLLADGGNNHDNNNNFICICVYVCIHMCVCMYRYIYIYIHVHTYTYTCIYTHIYIQASFHGRPESTSVVQANDSNNTNNI